MRPYYKHLFRVLLYQVQEYNVEASSSLSFNSSNNHTTNLSTTSGFIFPNDHSQRPFTTSTATAAAIPPYYFFSLMESQSLFCVIQIGKRKCGKWGKSDFGYQVFITIRLHHRQLSSGYQITTIANSHISLAVLQQLLIFSYNVDFHTSQQ